jgi:DNA-binding NarL/FixJ family response regulator
MLTVFDDEEKVFAAIRAGAGGYILKNAEPTNLLHAISEVYNGGAPMTPNIARKVLQQFQTFLPGEKAEYHLHLQREKGKCFAVCYVVTGLSFKNRLALKLNINTL